MADIKLISSKFVELQQDNPPNTLYHYTGQSGFLGILATGKLWATKVQYMNDSTEFGMAVSIAKDLIRSRLSVASDNYDKRILDTVLSHLDAILMVNVCAVSFCSNPDLLSQWRGYSNEGVGYAIGFYSSTLLAAVPHCRLHHCIYVDTDQRQIVGELIDDMLEHKHLVAGGDFELSLGAAFERSLIECGAFFKDSSFNEEDEWRLITNVRHYNDDNFQFREGKSMPIPYYIIEIADGTWRNKISDITVGPCPHPDNAKAAIEGLLIHYSITQDFGEALRIHGELRPPVRISRIPYRSW